MLKALSLTMSLFVISSTFAADIEKGKSLFVSKCVTCHGDKAQGLQSEEAPMLAGQFDWYIVSQLQAFVKGERKNEKMMPYIKGLTNKDFENLAAYISEMRASN